MQVKAGELLSELQAAATERLPDAEYDAVAANVSAAWQTSFSTDIDDTLQALPGSLQVWPVQSHNRNGVALQGAACMGLYEAKNQGLRTAFQASLLKRITVSGMPQSVSTSEPWSTGASRVGRVDGDLVVEHFASITLMLSRFVGENAAISSSKGPSRTTTRHTATACGRLRRRLWQTLQVLISSSLPSSKKQH